MRKHFAVLIPALLAAASPSSAQSSLSANEVQEFCGAGGPSGFGSHVLLSGDEALVMHGAFTSSYGVQGFVRLATGWVHQSSPGFFTQHYTMSFAGSLLLQGFPFGSGAGRVAVWRKGAGSSWTQSWLDAPDPTEPQANFGIGTDVEGTTVVVGSAYHSQTFTQEGAVYVYEDVGGALVLRQTFYGGAADARLGLGVKLSGDDLLVTHWLPSPSRFDLRAFRRSGGAWSVGQPSLGLSLTNGNVGLDRGMAVVRYDAQSLRVLANSGNGWFVDTPALPLAFTHAASDIEIADGVIAVGDPEDDTATTNAGLVYLYARNDGWKLQATVLASDPAVDDRFGYGFAFDEQRLLVGSPGHDHCSNGGSVYAFNLVRSPAHVYCVPERASDGCVAHIGFQGTPSATSVSPFSITASSVSEMRSGALVYSTGGRAFETFAGGLRCVGSPRALVARQSSSSSGASCTGTLATDFNALVQSGSDPALVAGATVDAQWVYRDPAGSGGIATSDAIEFAIGP